MIRYSSKAECSVSSRNNISRYSVSTSTSQLKLVNFNWPPLTGHLTPDQVLAQVRLGINLDELVFSEGNITFWHVWNINRNTNPHLYSESSVTADDNYKPPHHKALESEGEDEESSPLPIPDPSGIHSRIPESEQLLEEQSSESMSYRLESHLGTVIEETFWERTTLELE